MTYVGEADTVTKHRLLGAADVLLNPTAWPEPFGMVMVEALACGTPVVGFPNGAAPEIVDHGRTGYLPRDVVGLAQALRTVDRIDRSLCRAMVASRFSVGKMVRRHLALYADVLARSTLDGSGHRRLTVASPAAG